MTATQLQELESRYVMGTYARAPVEFVRGSGTWLWDADGNEYLDFLAGISVIQIGHAHPRWVAAVQEQAERLAHVGNLFYTEPAMRLARRLSESSLGGKVFFANSGAEAIECALKLARKHRSGGDIVVLEKGFHGRTYGALSATPQETKQAPFAPLVPGFKVARPDTLRSLVDERTAAVIIEPIQGESGILPVADEVLHEARAACDSSGALLIFDEIQCGMARTGTMWAYEQVGVTPDVITVAKGLGGGLPIGACVTSPAYADVLEAGDHGSTFAGGPIPCAGALAVFDVIEEPGFLDSVRAKGDRLLRGLDSISGGRARGRGLMTAFAVDEDAPGLVRRALLEERLVMNATGPDAIRLEPPLTVSEDEIDEAIARLGRLVGSGA
jgi:predicted acetylornithine/succinylornithine family transaminase